MKKLLALVLTFLMSANLVLSVYAGDDVGVSTQIDYGDIAGKLDSTSESTTETTEITTETTTENVVVEDETETTTLVESEEDNTYVWDLSSDRTKDSEENGLKFVNGGFTVAGGAKIDGVQFSDSITAVANNAGIEFTPTSKGKFTIAYKISKGKTGYIFDETVPNKTGGSLYKKSTFDVENGKTYKAYVSGSKIQIYYLEFVAEQGENESTTEETTESTTEETTQASVDWPATEDATYWDFSTDKYAKGAPAGDDNGLIIGEKMSPKNSSVDGKYVQGSTNPTVRNRVPSAGSYYAFTAPTDGTFYVKVGLGGGKTSYICNNEVYNDKSKDLIFEGAYKLEAGKTYYVYSVTSKIKAFKFAFVSGGTEGESTEITNGIFTVTDSNNNVTQCMTFLEAVTAANGRTATITLNEDYYINSNDISNDSNSYSYGDKSRAPLISGINTKVTLVSNGKRHSIIRDTSDYTKTITVQVNPWYKYEETYILENFIVVSDGAELNIGSDNYNEGVIFDGGFKYDYDNQKLNPVIDGTNKGSDFGAFIGVKGGKVVLNNKVSLVRNYSVNHSVAWKAIDYAVINPLGSGSEIEINGADIAYNHGTGILCASNDCKITVKKTDIYYNETVGEKGAITLSDSADNLLFYPTSDAQIRSNKNYVYVYGQDSTELSNYLSDIYTSTAIYLDGSVEIGEICLNQTQTPIYFKESDRHKNTIAVSSYYYSLGSSTLDINVDVPADSEYANEEEMIKYDPGIIVKSQSGYYYRVRATGVSNGLENDTKTIKFSNILRDVIIYRENNNIGEDSARYGFVVAGAFSWGYANEEREEAEKRKWDAVGFDVVSSEDEDFDPSSAEPLFVNTNVAYYDGFIWGNETILPAEDTEGKNMYFVENPITGWALDRRCSPVLNGDMQNSAYWAERAKGVFGFEVKNLSANIKFYVRKHYIASAENTDGDYITDWIFINTPSLYTTSYADIVDD